MNEILIGAGFGIAGSLVRVLVAGLKNSSNKGRGINKNGFILYSVVVISIGAFSGIILGFGKVMSFLAGYAGLDLIDGYYAIFKKKSIKIKK